MRYLETDYSLAGHTNQPCRRCGSRLRCSQVVGARPVV